MEKNTLSNSKFRKILIVGISIYCTLIAILLVVLMLMGNNKKTSRNQEWVDPEILRSREYPRAQDGSENISVTNGDVKFSAFYLRDIDGDGYAEKIGGSCRKIGETETLYMELSVERGATVENGKIEINGENFYLQTVLPKDQQLKDNYISSNTSLIEFNTLESGTQKMIVRFCKKWKLYVWFNKIISTRQ